MINDWKIVLLVCLTLGLSPYLPEPHIIGKIKWIAGGAVGMKFLDWWDLVLHGTPFVLFLRLIFLKIMRSRKLVSL